MLSTANRDNRHRQTVSFYNRGKTILLATSRPITFVSACVVLTDNTELPDMIYMVQEIEEEIEHRGPHSP